MKKGLFLAFVAAIILFTGCGSRTTIVGKWEADGYKGFIYTFNEDKTCSYDVAGSKRDCTYEMKDNKLSILFNGDTAPFETEYRIENNQLIIKDSLGNDVKYNAI